MRKLIQSHNSPLLMLNKGC